MDQVGTIIDSFARDRRGGARLFFVGRFQDGSTFAAVEDRVRPGFYLREGDWMRLPPPPADLRVREGGMRTMDGELCRWLSWPTVRARDRAAAAFLDAGVRTYEADLREQDRRRLELGVRGSVRLRGAARPGRRVDHILVDPDIGPADWHPALVVLSLDLETEPRDQKIYAAGLSWVDHRTGVRGSHVFYAGALDARGVESVADEGAILRGLRDLVLRVDPDVIVGWNIIGFDFPVLARRFKACGMPLDIARSLEPAVFLPRRGGLAGRAVVAGRQVWDGARIVRAAPERYADYSLENVAQAVLGEGKQLTVGPGEGRVAAILRMRREDPEGLCRYCLRDAELVLEILDRTGLYDLSLRRCSLTGVAMDRAWTSVAAFEHMYVQAMHGRMRVAPTRGVDALPLTGASGGAILTPRAGLHRDVLVMDFQSLYPSIIRTFNIDPLTLVRGDEGGDHIQAPTGARFRREPGILPEMLSEFFSRRTEARERGDAVASYVYKIIMNSFYGVLGTPGCRFAGSDLAGSITGFGQHILTWCRHLLEVRGYRVLYGDTDSLFVTSGARTPDGPGLRDLVNEQLGVYCRRRYGVRSHLVLEFEKTYTHFFLPRMRDGVRGRAKGYAGRRLEPGGGGTLEIKGMEAVRTDWTDLARTFQRRCLELLFDGAGVQSFQALAQQTLDQLRQGRLDDALIYHRRLRKPVAAYTASRPPHVQAALLLPRDERSGIVSYLLTRAGPQPEGRLTAPIDTDHYVRRQLAPIASMFADVLGVRGEQLLNVERQMWLF